MQLKRETRSRYFDYAMEIGSAIPHSDHGDCRRGTRGRPALFAQPLLASDLTFLGVKAFK
jgi:hypothetical protein